jgi:hypothetical protein
MQEQLFGTFEILKLKGQICLLAFTCFLENWVCDDTTCMISILKKKKKKNIQI